MSVEDRLTALEARLRAAEDHLEILNLLNSYGPLVDSGMAQEAVDLWIHGGGYNFTLPDGSAGRVEAPEPLSDLYRSDGHMGLVNAGSAHMTATPKISVNGDDAQAVGYSFVILREGDAWSVWRAAVNHWTLRRTDKGWRVKERYNRTLNGSEDSHAAMRKVCAI